MSFIPGHVYILYNSASGTVLDLSNGDSRDGTRCQGWQAVSNGSTFNQQWLFVPVTGQQDTYTLCDLCSGTYLDLSNGSSGNGTQVQGWAANPPSSIQNQQWVLSTDDSFYRLMNKAGGTFLELSNGGNADGTKAQGWARTDVPQQRWTLLRVSRSGADITNLIEGNQYIGPTFNSYLSDGLYIVPPQSVRDAIYNGTGLSSTTWRTEIFDCDDFAFAAKAAVSLWGNSNLRANGCAILFGLMFGENASGAKHAYNWYPSPDFSSIIFFEPQHGNEMVNPGYNGYFSVF